MGRAGYHALRVVLVAAVTLLLAATALVASPSGHPSAGPLEAAGASPAIGGRVQVAPALLPASSDSNLGPVPANLSLTVDVGLASRDPTGLTGFVTASEVPGTPAYQRYLSAGAADARFGASPASVSAAEAYFAGFGLRTVSHPDGLLLSVIGAGPSVARAFGTTLDLYRSGTGAPFVSPATPATLPEIAPWTGVLGLSTSASAMFQPEVAVEPLGGALTAPAAGCASSIGLSPCDVGTAYDFPWRTGGANGSGRTIAIIDAYSAAESQDRLAQDFWEFTNASGLARGNLTFAYPVPTTADLNATGTNSNWDFEDALDVQWSRGAAPGATIEMVFSPNAGPGLYFAVDWVVAGHEADVLSMSWGEPEVGVFNAGVTPCSFACNATTDGSIGILDPLLELGAAEGISTFAASGDCGAADGTSGVAVNYPASDPYVTGVGATNLSPGPGESYGSEEAWGGNSSGAHAPGCQNQGGSGGGFSTLPRPWWQTGEGTVPAKGRGVPDVAIVGGSGSSVGIVVGGSDYTVAGTSVATPIWAGIASTADQVHAGDLGLLNPALYSILNKGSSYAANFHNITKGWNGYPAAAGWNPITGIGTPIVGRLLTNLSRGPTSVPDLSAFVYASPRFGSVPLNVRFAVGAHGGSGTYALEGVAFGDGNASSAIGGLTNHTFDAPGVYSVQSYVVDSAGNTSTSPPVVVVVGGGGPLGIQLNASVAAPAVGATDTFTATETGGTGPFFYNFSFGDGTFSNNLTSPDVNHAYLVAGSYCAEVVVRNAAATPFGAASARVPVAVGGAPTPACGNPPSPLNLTGNSTEGVRDAPADFPSLFHSSGGTTAPDGLPRRSTSSGPPPTIRTPRHARARSFGRPGPTPSRSGRTTPSTVRRPRRRP